ncbi:MAG TPA: hypothetical protein VIN56_06080 [Candidatus Dormibacteraeota bacterium]|jgi:hypothetical protein
MGFRRGAGLLPVLAVMGAMAIWAVPAAAVPEGPAPGTPDWYAREAANVAHTTGEQQREAADPNFQVRLTQQGVANQQSFALRQATDPDWNSAGNVCERWDGDCAGDPYRYPGTDPFYDTVGQTSPISYYDDGGARISGRVWAPKYPVAGYRYPAVVIETGSVQAPETLYWWFAQTLVRSGYIVMTFDVRGQGRSDNHTPSGAQGSNVDSSVFWNGLVDAIDWFRSTPSQKYTYNAKWLPSHPLASPAHPNTDFNPDWQLIDPARLGIAGHSLGATGVSIVQGLDPWPGIIGHGGPNPVKVTVAWDNLAAPGSSGMGSTPPAYKIRTPSLGSSNDYSLVVMPYTSAPDPEGKKQAFTAWEKAGVPTVQLVIQGATHYEYSLLPDFPVPFPTSNWKTWGNPFADHYSLAWIDRWLKKPNEPGYADADQRLLQDSAWGNRMSFYFRSARDFPDRAGTRHVCQDIRAGCHDTSAAYTPPPYVPSAANNSVLPNTAPGLPGAVLLMLAAAVWVLRLALRPARARR